MLILSIRKKVHVAEGYAATEVREGEYLAEKNKGERHLVIMQRELFPSSGRREQPLKLAAGYFLCSFFITTSIKLLSLFFV